jgi:uncharacterized membrane protein YfcA
MKDVQSKPSSTGVSIPPAIDNQSPNNVSTQLWVAGIHALLGHPNRSQMAALIIGVVATAAFAYGLAHQVPGSVATAFAFALVVLVFSVLMRKRQ